MSASKKPMLQTTLGRGIFLFRAGKVPVPDSVLPRRRKKDDPVVPPAPGLQQATADALAAAAAAGCGQRRKRGRALHPERPVEASISLGWARVKLNLTLRSPDALVKTESLKEKRTTYSQSQKRAAIDAIPEGVADGDAAKRIRTVAGYEKVTGKQLQRWRTAGPRKKSGPKVNSAFEQAVLDELVYTSIEQVDGAAKAVVVANVTHSYAVIKLAAKKVQKKDQFKSHELVRDLSSRSRGCGAGCAESPCAAGA